MSFPPEIQLADFEVRSFPIACHLDDIADFEIAISEHLAPRDTPDCRDTPTD